MPDATSEVRQPALEHGPSRTAIAVAIHRAIYQAADQPPVFADPLAARIISSKARAAMDGPLSRGLFNRVARATLAVRSRLAEDTLADAVARGVRQYVVLGAGLDTCGLRNTDATLTVFEVDHPKTQAWKRKRIGEEGLPVPATLRFVAVDFTRDDLSEQLRRGGFRPELPAFYSWLGVVMYLEPEDIRATLRIVAETSGTAGGIVFDFFAPPKPWQLLLRFILWQRGRRVASLGEPFRAPLPPAEVERWLREAGFSDVALLGPRQLEERFLQGRRRRVSPLTWIAVARGSAVSSNGQHVPGEIA